LVAGLTIVVIAGHSAHGTSELGAVEARVERGPGRDGAEQPPP
jgi:hypothetical protein